jgi:hypothetical protein
MPLYRPPGDELDPHPIPQRPARTRALTYRKVGRWLAS